MPVGKNNTMIKNTVGKNNILRSDDSLESCRVSGIRPCFDLGIINIS